LESAAALLSGGLALPSDELIMKLNLAAHGTRSGGARSGMPSGMRRGARLCVRSEGGLLDSGPVDNASTSLPTRFPGYAACAASSWPGQGDGAMHEFGPNGPVRPVPSSERCARAARQAGAEVRLRRF
jgi:hypothetical protein